MLKRIRNNSLNKIVRTVYKNTQIVFQLFADILAIWITFAFQLYFRFYSGVIEVFALPTIFDYLFGSVMMTLFWLLVFSFNGMYRNWQARSPFEEFFSIIKTTFLGNLIIILLILSDTSNSIKGTFLLYWGVSTLFFIIFRFIVRQTQFRLRKKKILVIPTIIIGDLKHSTHFYEQSIKNPRWGTKVIGIILTKELDDTIPTSILHYDKEIFIGNIKNFEPLINQYLPEEVVLADGFPCSEELFKIETICTLKAIRVLISPNLYDNFTGRSRTQNLYGIPLIEITSRIIKPWQALFKRTFDIVFSISVIIVGMPLWLIISAIIKLESKGNVFYTQPRIGKNNKIFTIYKFRSMSQSECADPDNPQWTKVGDARVTKFGQFTRKSHLDEVPQFWNVLKGDMSVIGPRPEQPKFVEEFASKLSYYNRRHLVRPGITGWWQVKYKAHVLNLEEIKSRTKDDFYYIENFSIRLEFEILIRTIWAVIRGHGQT